MPNIKSAKKRVKVNATKALQNQMVKNAMRTELKSLMQPLRKAMSRPARRLWPARPSAWIRLLPRGFCIRIRQLAPRAVWPKKPQCNQRQTQVFWDVFPGGRRPFLLRA